MSKEIDVRKLLNKVMNDNTLELLLEMQREENNMSDESLQDNLEADNAEE